MENNGLTVERLNVLIKLTAANVIQGKNFKDQVSLLSSVGLQPKEISDILGKTSNHINVTLTMLRKERNKKSQTSKEEVENNDFS